MTNGISDFYRELTPREVVAFDAYASTAWQDDAMPWRQYFRVVSCELEVWRRGDTILPYQVALDCLKALPITNPTLLDVGASSAYYSEVFKVRDYKCRYTALDYSEAFKRMAKALYPDVPFDVGDARSLPYQDNAFDVVLHGSAILHIRDYEKAIAEAARVASKYVLFHRTAIETKKPTTFHAKEAYGAYCLECRINHEELVTLFQKHGLRLKNSTDLFMTEDGYGHRTYVTEKI